VFDFIRSKLSAAIRGQVVAVNSQITNQVSTLRREVTNLLGISHEGKRDLNDIYGYPDTVSVDFQNLYQLSRRDGIANRLTFGTARTCWREGFRVVNDEEDEQLGDELKALNKKGLLNKIERADILNRIGSFSVLFVGVPDGLDPREPIGKVAGDGFKSIYFKPFAYDGIEISGTIQDRTDPRFGLPEFYTVQKQSRGDANKDVNVFSMVVHWTRIIHMSEGALDSDVEGMGYLEPIYNRLLDINKTTGGASEAYFRNAKGKIAYEVDKDFATTLTDPAAKAAMDDGAKKYTNEFQDHTFAAGATVKTLITPHYTPKDTVMTALWAISGYSGYPIRILTGEGSGQLAGSEDQLALNAIISDRQNVVCAEWVGRLFEILSMAGMITWNDDWSIEFPKQSTTTEDQQAELDGKKGATLLSIAQAKTQPGGDEIDFRSALDELGLSEIGTEVVDDDDDIDLDGGEL